MASGQNDTEIRDQLFERAEKALKKYWGYPAFRPGQDEVVKSVFDGKETLVLFPTGGGKSLCYQVPSLVLDGLTIVISPLVALMEDQVEQLVSRGIKATYINSSLNRYEIEQRLVNARNGMYKLLYCAPERLKTNLFQSELPNLSPALIAIDEAHCISEWGHDFRPSYRDIREAMEPAGSRVRWLALTATATPQVRDDILESLNFNEPNIISKGFERPNLTWWVYKNENRMAAIKRMVMKQPGASGLIYAGSRKSCDELAAQVQQMTGVKTSSYHAGHDAAKRTLVQEKWISGEIPLVAATNAFGMGIDKSDCRYVIHYDAPSSLEAYYQEAGRAGRDGDPGYPLLLHKPAAFDLMRRQIEDSYPTLEQLRKLYRGICDSLGLAIGSGMEKAQPLNMADVEKRTGIKPGIILAGLRIFQRLEIFENTVEYERKLGVQFLFDVAGIRSLTSEPRYNERKKNFVMDMFRLFGPESVHELVYLSLKRISERTGLTVTRVIAGLDVLKREQVLRYQLVSGDPVVRIINAREEKPGLNREMVEMFRNVLFKKLDHMQAYAETTDCRSKYLRTYFGESNPPACGNCDNCLKGRSPVKYVYTQELKLVREALDGREGMHIHQLAKKTSLQTRRLSDSLKWMMKEGIVTRERRGDGAYYKLNRSKE